MTNLFRLPPIIAFIALFSLLIGCSTSSAVSTPSPTPSTQDFQVPSSYTTYTDETSLFSVSYPDQWEPVPELADLTAKVKEDINNLKTGLPVDEPAILYMAGLKTTSGYLPNVSIVVDPLPSGVSDIYQSVSAEILGIKDIDPKYQEVSRTKTVVNGKDAVLVEYKAHFSATSSLSHNLVLITLSGKSIWVVTCSATDEIYSQWENDFTNIARSFKINN